MLSAVVPVFNEEESLDKFYPRLASVLPKLDKEYEIIFVDDGSQDKTLELLKELEKKDKNVRVFSFRRNHGKAEALTFGLQKAKEGFDLVAGWRKNRKDSFVKIIFSKFFNLMAFAFWGIKLHDYNSGLKLYTKDAAKSLNLYGGMHRFVPLLVAQQGFKVTEVPVVHDIRRFGKSKYNA